MAVTKKVCRVCGKSYEACRTAKHDVGVFNWREVACSPECGTEYLRRVNEARNPTPVVTTTTKRSKVKEPVEADAIMKDVVVHTDFPEAMLDDMNDKTETDEGIVE